MIDWCCAFCFRMGQFSARRSYVPSWSVLMVRLPPTWQGSVAKSVSVSRYTQTPLIAGMCTFTPFCQSCLFLPSHPHTTQTHKHMHTHHTHSYRYYRYCSNAFHCSPPQGCLTTDHISLLLSYMLTMSPEVSSSTYTYPNKLFTSRQ